MAVAEIQESVRLSSRRTAALETDHLREKERADARHARNMEELAAIRAIQAETALQMKETDRRMAETAQQMKETDPWFKEAEILFTTPGRRLLESLIEGDLVPLFQERGIDVRIHSQLYRGNWNGEPVELDGMVVSDEEVVVMEVKTTLRWEDVTCFLAKLGRFKECVNTYRDHRILGAVAFLEADSNVIRQAERRGLFVIRATGSSASILNPPDFTPRVFH